MSEIQTFTKNGQRNLGFAGSTQVLDYTDIRIFLVTYACIDMNLYNLAYSMIQSVYKEELRWRTVEVRLNKRNLIDHEQSVQWVDPAAAVAVAFTGMRTQRS